MKVEYPLLPSDKKDAEEFTKEELISKYYGQKNRFGFFPIGRLNSWHGGIHIESSSSKVRAVADGRIIAYRITEDLLTEKERDKKYSNSFILIQHNFETPKKQKLRFYSLYMHLQTKNQLESGSGKHIPNLYAKYIAKVTGKQQRGGLNARSGSETYVSSSKKWGKIKMVIYKDEIVSYDISPITGEKGEKIMGASFADDHWINDHDYKYIPIIYKGHSDLAEFKSQTQLLVK